MLEFEIVPEQGLRNDAIEFVIGSTIGHVLCCLQKLVGIVKGVELLYSQQSPFEQEIVISLTQDGVKLFFEPVSQRLKLIEVNDLSKLTLKYCNLTFASRTEKPVIQLIDQAFGATHPGVYDSNKQMFRLSWRGLSFFFPVHSDPLPYYAHGLGSLQFPNDASPIASKVCVYHGESVENASAPELPLRLYCGDVRLESLEIVRNGWETIGINVKLMSQTMRHGRVSEMNCSKFSKQIRFGDSSTDVLAALGAPSRIFYKSDEKIKIHLPSAQRSTFETRPADYYYNYFTLGFDVLLDGESHSVKKFILHGNIPGHYDFGIYHRCNFELRLPTAGNSDSAANDSPNDLQRITCDTKWQELSRTLWHTRASSRKTPTPNNPQGSTTSSPVPKTRKQKGGNSNNKSGVGSRGAAVDLDAHAATLAAFAPPTSNVNPSWAVPPQLQPVILNRSSSSPVSAMNPFGSTFCYGFQDMIFEVMANDAIASVILYWREKN